MTKTHVLPPRQDLVARPDLQAKLGTGLTRPLTLISAPAGFGTTILLNSAVHALTGDFRTAWLALDEDDNDVLRQALRGQMQMRNLAAAIASLTQAAWTREAEPLPLLREHAPGLQPWGRG